MPLAKIHVHEGRYDERRLTYLSKAVQQALMSILKIPPDDHSSCITGTELFLDGGTAQVSAVNSGAAR